MKTDEIYIFKVKDYTTEIVGRKRVDPDTFQGKDYSRTFYYVERGDGTTYDYEECRVEWAKKL